jgi:hypothetical protein
LDNENENENDSIVKEEFDDDKDMDDVNNSGGFKTGRNGNKF